MEFLPSVIAASAIAVARHTLGQEAWDEEMIKNAGYELNQLKAGIEFLSEMFEEAPAMAQHAIQDKYKSSKYLQVSTLNPRETPINFSN